MLTDWLNYEVTWKPVHLKNGGSGMWVNGAGTPLNRRSRQTLPGNPMQEPIAIRLALTELREQANITLQGRAQAIRHRLEVADIMQEATKNYMFQT